MKTQPPEAPKPTRSPRERGQKFPPSADVCRGLSLAAALALGCTGVPVRPEPFTCPEGAQRAMFKQLGWWRGEQIVVLPDDRYDRWGEVWLRPGDTVVGVVPDRITHSRMNAVAPAGTQFLGGKVYVSPERTEDGDPGSVIVKYERVKVPNRDEMPVCFIVELKVYELKDGAAKIRNAAGGTAVDHWP